MSGDPDLYDLIASDQQRAVGNVANAQTVAPQRAVDAMGEAAVTGTPASVGMHVAAPENGMAAFQNQTAILKTSPSVASFAGSDAAKAAATKDDFGSLAGIAHTVNRWNDVANADFFAPGQEAIHALMRDVPRWYADHGSNNPSPLDLIPGFSSKDQKLGSVLSDLAGVAFSPFNGALNAAARPFSYIPQPIVNKQTGAITYASQPQAQSTVAGAFGTALFGLHAGPSPFAEPVRPPPVNEGTFGAPRRITGPGEVVPDAQFTDVPPPGVAPDDSLIHQSIAEADADNVVRMQEAIAGSKTLTRSPDLMQDFLENHTAASGQEVSIPAESITKLWQQGHEVFQDQGPQILDALNNGGDVKIPISQYLTETAGKPFAEELNAASRFRDGGVSQDEGKTLPTPEVNDAGEPVTEEPVHAQKTSPPLQIPEDLKESTERVQTIAARAEDAIERVFKETALDKLFQEPAATGLTKGQFERYAERVDEARTATREHILEKTFTQIRRERTPEFKAAVDLHKEAITAQLEAQPNVQAYRALRDPLFKLDTEKTGALYPDLPIPAALTKRGGLSPDEAAELTGHSSGSALVQDLHHLHEAVAAHGGSLNDYLKNRVQTYAEEQARQMLGYDVSPQGLLDAAREAMVEPAIEDLLIKDLKQLAEQAGLPFDKATMQLKAEEIFGNQLVEDAIKPKTFAENMRRLGNKAEAALIDENPVKAFMFKQQQYLQYKQLAESFKTAKSFAKDLKLWNSLAKKPVRAGVAQDAVNWSKDILRQIGLQVKGNAADLTYPISGYQDLRSFITAKTNLGADIVWAPIPQVKKPQDMKVDAYRGVANMVRSIIKTGREEQLVRVGTEKRDLESTVNAGIAQLNRYTRVITHEEKAEPNFLQRIDRARRFVDAWGVRLEQLMLDFGERNINSPFFQVVSRRLEEAKGWSLDKRTELAKHFNEVNKDVGKGLDDWMKTRLPDGPHKDVVTRAGDPIFNTNKDVMVAALHMGDREALSKFAEGYNAASEFGGHTFRGVPISEIESVVSNFATPQMWKAVEGIWKAFADLRPEIERQFRNRTGVSPQMVEPRPFTSGAYSSKGGYFPVMYDPAGMPKEWLDAQDPNALLGDPHYVRALPNNKYLKERTGVSAPVQMNLDQIYSRLNQVIHDLAYRDVLNDINKFLLHPRMSDAIARKYGPEYVGKIRRNLERIARAESTDTNENRAVSKAVDYLTEGQMINMIGLSPTTVLKHGTTAAFQPFAEVGAARYAGAMWDYMRDADSVGRAAEIESPEVRHIISAYGEDSYQQFLALTSKTGLAAKYRRFAFHTIGFVNKQIAIATYNAAKEKLRDENPGLDEASIQAGANQVVRQALGSSGPTDAPDALSAGRSVPGRFYRLQNQFLTFFSHMYNRSREIPQALGYAGNKVDLSRAIALLITSIVIPVTVDAVFGREVKKTGSWLGGLAVSLIHQIAAPWPGINTVVGAGLHKATHGEYQSHDSALASIGEMVGANAADISALLKKHEVKMAMIQHALITLGQATQSPGLEASRLLGFFQAVATGKEHNKSLPQKIEDFIYGPSTGHKAKGGK